MSCPALTIVDSRGQRPVDPFIKADRETDQELLTAIGRGDADAFGRLLDRHLDAIHRYLLRMTGSTADAEDLAQETFVRVWLKSSAYRPDKARVTTWLHRIAHNLCVDSFRKRPDSAPADWPADSYPGAADEEEAVTLADPARLSSAAEQQRLLHAAIARLPINQRSAVLLCQVQGFSNAQAADILGVSNRALESLLVRARRRLRMEMFASNGEPSEGPDDTTEHKR